MLHNWTIPGMTANWIGDEIEAVKVEKIYSPIFKGFSAYQALKKFCKDEYLEYDSQVCVNTFTFFKPHDDYDIILGNEKVEPIINYNNHDKTINQGYALERI